ncbi:MAG TPA: hypothetical protein VL400_23825 [Polyangiaceae bacterium]|jgi:hypothetical protein|nr:hypothetical protein [Polyangiaceae bacterium]
MLGHRTFVFACACAAVGLAAAAGCNNNVIVPDGDGGGIASGGNGTGLIPSSSGYGGNGGEGGLGQVVDPPCPDKPPPITAYECDPYDQFNGQCQNGEACYIYVQYPDEPCGQEIYGALCYPAGIGVQGDPCGGAQDCGPGLACVVTGTGTQCVVLCPLQGDDNCPSGYVCEPIDVEGFGGCL